MKKAQKIQQLTAGIAAIALIGGVGVSSAQPPEQQAPPPHPQPQEGMADLRQLQQEAQQIEARLSEIARQAEQENPELLQKQEDLETMYRAKLEEFGYPDEERLGELQEMQRQLQQAEDMDPAEREQLSQQFQAEVTQMQQAQMQAQQDAEIQEAIEDVQNARTEAMREIDPEAPALEQQLEQLSQQLRQHQQRMMQQQQHQHQQQQQH